MKLFVDGEWGCWNTGGALGLHKGRRPKISLESGGIFSYVLLLFLDYSCWLVDFSVRFISLRSS